MEFYDVTVWNCDVFFFRRMMNENPCGIAFWGFRSHTRSLTLKADGRRRVHGCRPGQGVSWCLGGVSLTSHWHLGGVSVSRWCLGSVAAAACLYYIVGRPIGGRIFQLWNYGLCTILVGESSKE